MSSIVMSIWGRKAVVLPVLLVLLVAMGVGAESRAIGLSGSAIERTSEGGQRWALVIGINEYHNVPRLRFARQDAQTLADSLSKAGFPRDNIMVMTDTVGGHSPLFPTRGNLRARINQLAEIVGKNDVLLVFFSGHGTQKNGDGFLVPIDGDSRDIGSLVPLSWVRETLESSPAKHRLLILDACHSGAKAGDASDSPAKALLGHLDGAAFATLSSCDIEQLSYEDEDNGHGVFTGSLIDGLSGRADSQAEGNGDGTVTASELWAYAALGTKQWGLRSGKVQTPVLKGNFKGRIELVRFKTVQELKDQKTQLRKKLEAMEELNRTSAAEELRKEIAKLESQLSTIGGGVSDITGSDEVQLAYARYDAAQKQVDDLKNLLSEKLGIYQPTSSAITKIKQRIATAKSELQTALDAKYQADAIMYEALQTQIEAKQASYEELTKDLLPSAPQAKKLVVEIRQLDSKRSDYETGYIKIKISELLSIAYANDNKADGMKALKALDELLELFPDHNKALSLQNKIIDYYLDAGDVMTDSFGMKFAYIPPGNFMMGSNNGDSDEKPIHKVEISKGFWIGVYEVFQAQFKYHKSEYRGDNNPVENVSWHAASDYCKNLSRKEGRVYRLPTEAEWEYACRAGTTTEYSSGNGLDAMKRVGWCSYSSEYASYGQTKAVGSFFPNAFGLYDMHGNTYEWCSDWYGEDYYKNSPEVDPQGPQDGMHRVCRGGNYYMLSWRCRSASRYKRYPDSRTMHTGFRVVLEVFSRDIP